MQEEYSTIDTIVGDIHILHILNEIF